jgi:hypothetical protein
MCLYQLQLLDQAPLLSWRLLFLDNYLCLLRLFLRDLWLRLGLLGFYSLLLVHFGFMRFWTRFGLQTAPTRNREICEHVMRVGWVLSWSRQGGFGSWLFRLDKLCSKDWYYLRFGSSFYGGVYKEGGRKLCLGNRCARMERDCSEVVARFRNGQANCRFLLGWNGLVSYIAYI